MAGAAAIGLCNGIQQPGFVDAFAQARFEFNMEASPSLMPPVRMLETSGMINKRAGAEWLPAAFDLLFATSVQHQTEKGVGVRV